MRFTIVSSRLLQENNKCVNAGVIQYIYVIFFEASIFY